MRRDLLVGCLIIFSIFICCTKAVTRRAKGDAAAGKKGTSQYTGKIPKMPDEFGLQWTLSFIGSALKMDSISVDDNPAIMVQMQSLRDSIYGRVDKIDNKFDRGFKDIINIINGKKKLVLPVNKNGDFSFRGSDILEKGYNDVYFDLVCNRGYWLTNVIVVMFAVSD